MWSGHWLSSKLTHFHHISSFLMHRGNAAGDWHCSETRTLSQNGGQEVPTVRRCSHPWGAAFFGLSPLQPASFCTERHLFQRLHNPQGILNFINMQIRYKRKKTWSLTLYVFFTGDCHHSLFALCAERRSMGNSLVLQPQTFLGPEWQF